MKPGNFDQTCHPEGMKYPAIAEKKGVEIFENRQVYGRLALKNPERRFQRMTSIFIESQKLIAFCIPT